MVPESTPFTLYGDSGSFFDTLHSQVDECANADPPCATVKSFQTMKSVFNALSSSNGAGGRFTIPIRKFENATNVLKSSYNMNGPIELPKDASRLGPIATLIRNLVPAKSHESFT